MATGILGAIGKFAKGVAEVGVPAALEQHRANILAKRDSVLQGYNMEAQKDQQEFTKGENDRQRTLTREERKADREHELGMQGQAQEFTGEQNDLDRAIEEARLEIQEGAQALDSKRIDSIIQLTNLQIEDLGLDMGTKKQVNELQQAVVDADTPDAMDAALTRLQGFLGKEIYNPMTVYGEEDPVTGNQPRASGVINTVTGGFTPMGMPTDTQPDLTTPEGIRSAMRSGNINRDRARQLLESFQSQP